MGSRWVVAAYGTRSIRFCWIPTLPKEQLREKLLQELPRPSTIERNMLVEGWIKRKKFDTDQKLSNWLNKEHIQEAQLHERIEREWLWLQWCIKNFGMDFSDCYLEEKACTENARRRKVCKP